MKRMNEVFELPVASNQVYISPNLIERNREKGVSNADVLEHAAHAINNVDALADALEFLLSLPRGSSGRIIIEKSEEFAATSALNTYRGAK